VCVCVCVCVFKVIFGLCNSKLLSINTSKEVNEISGADTSKEGKITVWDVNFREVMW